MPGLPTWILFPLKAQVWGFCTPVGNQMIFRSILKVSYKRAFLVKYYKILKVQNSFRSILSVSTYIYTVFLGNFVVLGEFLGIFCRKCFGYFFLQKHGLSRRFFLVWVGHPDLHLFTSFFSTQFSSTGTCCSPFDTNSLHSYPSL
jgi:hypothetical protein